MYVQVQIDFIIVGVVVVADLDVPLIDFEVSFNRKLSLPFIYNFLRS